MRKRRPESVATSRPPRQAREAASPHDPSLDRAALALWITLALLAAARAALGFAHGTWAWSLSLHRFLSPVTGWGLWLVAAVVLVPPVARRVSPLVARWGDAVARRPVRP